MGCKAEALQRALWGDYTYQPKTQRIVRIRAEQQGRARPLFVQLALEPIWKVGAAPHGGAREGRATRSECTTPISRSAFVKCC